MQRAIRTPVGQAVPQLAGPVIYKSTGELVWDGKEFGFATDLRTQTV
jgi:hypothetical protein